ncbi:PREDICTED: uncharacterized protein LOC104993107 isoform X2 [Bison bison bison]|nr:PREDICTED: uncharacterized protein LOC104993107 isoform X2 [Bison bison bison]
MVRNWALNNMSDFGSTPPPAPAEPSDDCSPADVVTEQRLACPMHSGARKTETLESAPGKGLLQRQARKTGGLCSKPLNSLMVWGEKVLQAKFGLRVAGPNLLFGTQGRPRRLKSVSYKQEMKDTEGICAWETHRVLLGFNILTSASGETPGLDSACGSVVESLPADPGDMSSIASSGKIPHVMGQLSPCAAAAGAHLPWSLCSTRNRTPPPP